MSKSQRGGPRKPATKLPHLQKKIRQQKVAAHTRPASLPGKKPVNSHTDCPGRRD